MTDAQAALVLRRHGYVSIDKAWLPEGLKWQAAADYTHGAPYVQYAGTDSGIDACDGAPFRIVSHPNEPPTYYVCVVYFTTLVTLRTAPEPAVARVAYLPVIPISIYDDWSDIEPTAHRMTRAERKSAEAQAWGFAPLWPRDETD